MTNHNICFLQEIRKKYICHNLDTLLSYEVLVPGPSTLKFLTSRVECKTVVTQTYF